MPKSRDAASDTALKLSNQLCFAVYSTALAFNAVYKPLLERLGLTYPQYLAMLALWEQDDVPVKEIGRLLHLDSGTLTPLLKRLETAGLVTRTRHREDERQVRITLTAAGRALREQAKAVPLGIFEACGLSTPTLLKLKDELITLRERLDAAAP
ncbi:MarR family winged helix-turn-helix transcriptional regulator [Solimonas soli]|uniref:MarR family winged helix-turn-helix transcriptional regulator n=1 Tax=Solimonas soli TaxID=413479 RepID=UPI0004851E72|nr:MarR family transcriptional regulator [Solimonas soli]